MVDISAGTLATQSQGNPREHLTEYEKNGMDKRRIDTVLASNCGCAQGCYQKLNRKEVYRIAEWWHAHLSVEERSYTLYVLHDQAVGNSESDGSVQRRVRWSLNGIQPLHSPAVEHGDQWHRCSWACPWSPGEVQGRNTTGVRICQAAFAAVLGTSKRPLSKCAKGRVDLRAEIAPTMREAPQARKVHEFFLGLYRTAAEPLPHEHYMVRGNVDRNIDITENLGSSRFRSSRRRRRTVPMSARKCGPPTGRWSATLQRSLATKSGSLDGSCHTAS